MTEPARQLAASIAVGATTAHDHARAVLERIAALPSLGALLEIDHVRFLEAAREIDYRRQGGSDPGELAGLLFAVKDNIDVSGCPTTACTPALAANIPQTDAEAVARLKAAGAIVLGKAVMHELAMGGTSNNPHMPPVRNPRAPDFIAGGSSGGSAAAVAAALCDFSLGSDTGGSVPIPASLCGVAGLRPSVGRYPSAGLFATNPSRDVIGPLAGSADDLRLIDAIISGEPERPVPAPADLRLGLPRRYFWEGADAKVQRALSHAIKALSDAGATIVETEVQDLEALSEAVSGGLRVESSCALGETLAALNPPVAVETLIQLTHSSTIAETLSTISRRSAAREQIEQALHVHRPRLQQAFDQALTKAGADALLVPATPLPAVPMQSAESLTINGREEDFFSYTRATLPAANAGLPFLSIPAARVGLLPVGLGLIGRLGGDASLLAIGTACEAVLIGSQAPVSLLTGSGDNASKP